MTDEFLNYSSKHQLFKPEDNILVGVSGGVDSMVMLDLFLKTGTQIGIAHVNFKLRGKEADEEQKFVENYAKQKGIVFHTVDYKTHEYASEYGLSIQVAARKLRYQWFDDLMKEHNYSCVAVAHNKNDEVETLLINLARGTGIRGITGIKSKKNNIIRPLLFAERKEIEEYALQNNIPYREDSSNLSVKYSRNRIRYNVIPELEAINPRFIQTTAENIERFQSACNIYDSWIEEIRKRIVNEVDEKVSIDIDALMHYKEQKTILYEILKTYSFTKELAEEILQALQAEPGKCFYSKSHKAVKDRQYLIVVPLRSFDTRRYYIERGKEKIDFPVQIILEEIDGVSNYSVPRDKNIASLDYDKLVFPLIIRKWQKGDFFKPLGLNHYKKLSDFFIDRKYSLLDKERVWLLTSGEKIVWVIGDRIDEHFKVASNTRKILKLTYYPAG